MGFRHFSTLLIVFFILMMIFGTARLREIGNDLAIAIRNFRKGLQDEANEKNDAEETKQSKNEINKSLDDSK